GTPEQLAAVKELDGKIAAVRRRIAAEVAKVTIDEDDDEAATEQAKREDYVWIEDDLPPSARPASRGEWKWVTRPDHPVYSGERATRRSAEGLSQHYFTDAKPGLLIGAGDTL